MITMQIDLRETQRMWEQQFAMAGREPVRLRLGRHGLGEAMRGLLAKVAGVFAARSHQHQAQVRVARAS